MSKPVSKRIAKLRKSLKNIGEIQVTEWDFMNLLNTSISDLEMAQSLRRFGNIKVMEWDFRTVLPAVKKSANREIDLVDIFKRTADYRVIEWDFRGALTGNRKLEDVKLSEEELHDVDMIALRDRLKNFLQYVALQLISSPQQAQIKVSKLEPSGLRFKLVLAHKDVSTIIGRDGGTAEAIRGVMKGIAADLGVPILLQIHSFEEEMIQEKNVELVRERGGFDEVARFVWA